MLKGLFTLNDSEGEDKSEFILEMVFVPIKQQIVSYHFFLTFAFNQ